MLLSLKIHCLGLYWSHPLATESSERVASEEKHNLGVIQHRQADKHNISELEPTSDQFPPDPTRKVVF